MHGGVSSIVRMCTAMLNNDRGENMRRAAGILGLTILLLGLAGCGEGQAPEINTLSFGKDGEVIHRIVGKTDQNYYQIEPAALEEFAVSRVEEYCAENGEKKVALEAVEEKSGSIVMDFKYASPEDYSNFNHRVLYAGTIESAADEGYELEAVPFVSIQGQASEIGYIEDWDKKKMFILETKSGEEMLVNLPGKTLYVNQGAHSGQELTFVGKKGVKISNQEEAGTTSLSYIIYE